MFINPEFDETALVTDLENIKISGNYANLKASGKFIESMEISNKTIDIVRWKGLVKAPFLR